MVTSGYANTGKKFSIAFIKYKRGTIFYGLVQYVAKFMPDVASAAKPIQELTRKDVTFKWVSSGAKSSRQLFRS